MLRTIIRQIVISVSRSAPKCCFCKININYYSSCLNAEETEGAVIELN